MEKKKCYLAPEAELRTTKIRCSILAGSDPSNVRPTGTPNAGGGGGTGDGFGGDGGSGWNMGARERGSLSF